MAAGIISARLAVAASGVGVGFAESLRTLTSARQAATGGVAIEDPWRSGSLLEATTVLLEPGDVRWGGLAYQSGFGEGVRLGAEGFIFGSAGSARSTENPDGTFGGEGGTASELQGGGRVAAIVEMARGEGWTVAGTGRLTGMIQRLPDERHGGLGLEAGAQARYALYEGAVLTAWGLAGPVGQGAGRGFADEVLAGAGVLAQRTTGLLGGAEGFGFGAEGAYLPKGLGQAGLGAVYWFGKPNGAGSTLFLRAGLRLAGGSAQGVQPRGGLGWLWRARSGWGLQFDYTIVPIGELGYYHYATIGIRLAPSRPRPVTVPETHPVEVQPASVRVAPIVATPPARPAEVIYFDPRRERARITVEVRTPSVLGASLLDEGGKALRELIAPHDVVPGAYVVEWDGVLETGPARLNQTYIMRISYDATTEFVNVIPKEAP